MPKRKTRRTKRRNPRKQAVMLVPVQNGTGFFDDVGRALKKTFSKRNIKKAGRFLKKHKVISRGGKILDDFGVPLAGKVGRVAGQLGFGHRRNGLARGRLDKHGAPVRACGRIRHVKCKF